MLQQNDVQDFKPRLMAELSLNRAATFHAYLHALGEGGERVCGTIPIRFGTAHLSFTEFPFNI
jgi:hypothetical protein